MINLTAAFYMQFRELHPTASARGLDRLNTGGKHFLYTVAEVKMHVHWELILD